MSLLCQFLHDRFESSISSIVVDNAKSPSEDFREYVNLQHSFATVPLHQTRQCEEEGETMFRAVNRYHSEPLMAKASTTHHDAARRDSCGIVPTSTSRWEAANSCTSSMTMKDHLMKMPKRYTDKRAVSRNRSDSILLVKDGWSAASRSRLGTVHESPLPEPADVPTLMGPRSLEPSRKEPSMKDDTSSRDDVDDDGDFVSMGRIRQLVQ